MKSSVLNFEGKVSKQVDLPPGIFGVPFKEEVLWRAILYQRSRKQTGYHQTKTIAYVSGGGRKPHRQKGTGRARQGSSRSGHMRGGACIFGPQVRSHTINLPKKVLLLSVKVALSQRAREGRLMIIENNPIKKVKTKKGIELLRNLKVNGKVLLVLNNDAVVMRKSVRNIPNTAIVPPFAVNTYDLVRSPSLVMTESALSSLVQKLEQGNIADKIVVKKDEARSSKLLMTSKADSTEKKNPKGKSKVKVDSGDGK